VEKGAAECLNETNVDSHRKCSEILDAFQLLLARCSCFCVCGVRYAEWFTPEHRNGNPVSHLERQKTANLVFSTASETCTPFPNGMIATLQLPPWQVFRNVFFTSKAEKQLGIFKRGHKSANALTRCIICFCRETGIFHYLMILRLSQLLLRCPDAGTYTQQQIKTF